jgi:hypothetical protein
MGKRGKKVSEKTRKGVLKLSKQYGVNYLASHFSLSKSEIYKILRQERKKPAHFTELSATALKLAEILGWYYKHHVFTVEPLISSDFPYTTHTPESPKLNERELSNLLAHLGDEIPELVPIGEYPKACEQWFALPDDERLNTKPPEVTITDDLILKLKLKGNQGDFTGKCPDCPR